jgi:hypothetical protein
MNARILMSNCPTLKNRAAILAVLTFTFLSSAANATEAHGTWTWTRTPPSSPLSATVHAGNAPPKDEPGAVDADADAFSDTFTVSHTLTPPTEDPGEGNHWVQKDPNPTTQIDFKGHWSGMLTNSSFEETIAGMSFKSYAKSFVSIKAGDLPAFDPSHLDIGGPGALKIEKKSATSFITGDATIPVSGSVDVSTLLGFPFGGPGAVKADAKVELTGEFKGPSSVDIIYTAVPEPETYAMMLAGLGLVGWRIRRAKS